MRDEYSEVESIAGAKGKVEKANLSKDQDEASLISRNIFVFDPDTGRRKRTSVRLEALEWEALTAICRREKMTVSAFCQLADMSDARPERSRTARIRMAILTYFMKGSRLPAGLGQSLGQDGAEGGRNIRAGGGHRERSGWPWGQCV